VTLQQYLFSFEGRVNRKWFWIAWGAGLAIGFLAYSINPVLYVLSVVLLWPQLAIGCKRFHDMGKTGWLQLIGLIPFVGGLILLVWLGAIAGDPHDNLYGPVPGDVQV